MMKSDGNGSIIINKKIAVSISILILLIGFAISATADYYTEKAAIVEVQNDIKEISKDYVPRSEINLIVSNIERDINRIESTVNSFDDKLDRILLSEQK